MSTGAKEKARLEKLYRQELRSALQKELQLDNIMAVPAISKVVINVGVKDALSDGKALSYVAETVAKISGQRPVKTKARKSIAGFKLREGAAIGVKVTLRRQKMYEFIDRLINISLPKVRDFQGVSRKFDGRGNYNLGVKEWIIFPELDMGSLEKIYGVNVTIHTTAQTDECGYALLKAFGMPFRA